jgi:bifunctional non-homologous end joining protein LigD
LNTSISYDETKPFAHEVARLLEQRHPELVVSEMKKILRAGKVFVDWSQNDDHKTTICVYSLRAKERPTVSTPLQWQEVERCFQKRDPELLVFTSDQALARAEKLQDLFAPVLTLKQTLPKLEQLPAPDPEHARPPAPLVRTAASRQGKRIVSAATGNRTEAVGNKTSREDAKAAAAPRKRTRNSA